MPSSGEVIETLFIHAIDDAYRIVGDRDGKPVVRGVLEVVERDPGPRPGRFRVEDGSNEEPRPPEEFVELARRAEAIRISEQTEPHRRTEIRELLEAYQLKATVVRTCRFCASAGRYGPITAETAVRAGDEEICPRCAKGELQRELAYRGDLTDAGEERLTELLYEIQDLERITDLLKGGVDPELTRVDVVSATREEVTPVDIDELELDDRFHRVLVDSFDTLLPVQSLAVRNGLLEGSDQLIVSATATGKTLIGELAGIDRALRGDGQLLFLVPLVALANQTARDLTEQYGDLVTVTRRVGASRIRDDGSSFDPNADVIVGTYEGIDHALRTGRALGTIGTVVIDEIHTLATPERGHRLDGLITRLKHVVADQPSECQWLYLSATVGNPDWLASRLDATLVEYEDRPVPIERHVTFAEGRRKGRICDRLVRRAFDSRSSKGYRGQTIVFTNSRRRCHQLARKIEYDAAAYHAGLDGRERAAIEERFGEGELAAVVTTAALGAGVDFPASQVIFERLAMGIEWLNVQEFEQMLGRAGRPDYHDRGLVYLLVEPGATYHGGQERTEDEVAFELLQGDTEDVRPRYGGAAAIEETLANLTVAGRKAKQLNEAMVGELPTKYALGKLIEYEFIDGFEPTPIGRVVTEHFLDPDTTHLLRSGLRAGDDPYDVVADVVARQAEER